MQHAAKYLQGYAEPEASAASQLDTPNYNHCLIIPCYNESPAFARQLMDSPLWRRNILVVVVINQPPGPSSEQNRKLNAFFAQFPCVCRQQNLSLFHPDGESAFLVVDAFSTKTLPAERGVGLARKIGCDTALSLFLAGRIKTPWLFSTDADARLPDDYFSAVNEYANAGAVCYQFEHNPAVGNPQLNTATRLYDRAIRYYAAGLYWAGSPYAFTSLGSALAIGMSSYCAVRGFPQRSGGEDFYLLNKVAKVAAVEQSPVTVCIESRQSDRVPFGTGPAVARIAALLAEQKPYTYYNPQCFVALRSTSKALTHLLEQAGGTPTPAQQDWQTLVGAQSAEALAGIGFHNALSHISNQCRTQAQAITALHTWFDGFKTLKFIRAMQALNCPALPLEECLARAPWALEGEPKT